MTDKEEAIKLFEGRIKKKVKEISDPRTGVSSITYKITDTNEKVYYFKKGNNNYEIQFLLNNNLNDLGVKTPKIIDHDRSWIIEEGVDGTKLDIKDRILTNKILEVFGGQLGRVHKIKTDGFGPLTSVSAGKFKTYSEYFKRLEHLIHKKYFDLLNDFINKDHETYLNHGDVAPDHVYVDAAGNYVSLIDWDDVVSAPREFDLSELLVNLEYDVEYWKSFMKGYSKHFEYVDINNKDLLLSALLQNYESYYWYLSDKIERPERLKRDIDRIEQLESKIDQW